MLFIFQLVILNSPFFQAFAQCLDSDNPRADFLITSSEKGSISKFTSRIGTCIVDPKAAIGEFRQTSYQQLFDEFYNKSKLPAGQKDSWSGSDLTITAASTNFQQNHILRVFENVILNGSPPSTSAVTTVVFVEKNLYIRQNFTYGDNTHGIVFIVKGGVYFEVGVTNFAGVIISQGDQGSGSTANYSICTAGNSTVVPPTCPTSSVDVGTNALIIDGTLVALDKNKPIRFVRKLTNNATAAEQINHQLKYLVILNQMLARPTNIISENTSYAICTSSTNKPVGCSCNAASNECMAGASCTIIGGSSQYICQPSGTPLPSGGSAAPTATPTANPTPSASPTPFPAQLSAYWKLDELADSSFVNSPNKPSGVWSYWNLDETQGTTVADSAGGRTGNISGTLSVSGKYTKARSFNNSPTGGDMIATAAVNGGLSSMTVGAWVNTTGTNNTKLREIVAQQSSTQGYAWSFLISGDQNHLVYGSNNCGGANYGVVESTVSVSGGWHHVGAVRDGVTGNVDLYIDGNKVSKTTSGVFAAGPICTTPIPISIGNLPGYNQFGFVGSIDEVGIWNRALTQQEMSSLGTYNSTTNYANGQIAEDSVGSNRGAVSGTNIVTGRFGYARDFFSGSYISVNNSPTFSSQSTTVSMWFYPKNFTVGPTASLYNFRNGLNQLGINLQLSPPTAPTLPSGANSFWKLDETSGVYAFDSINTSTTFSPGSISGLVTWLDANDNSKIVQTSGAISQWTDSSSAARNFTQGTASKRPTYVANGLNGKAVVHLAAASGQTLTNSVNVGNSNTIIYLSRQSGGTNGRMLSGLVDNWLLGYWNGYKAQAYFNGWVYGNGGPYVSDAGWQIFSEAENAGINTAFYWNGIQMGFTSGGTGPNGLSLNGHQGISEFSDGDIAEVLVYNRLLSDVERGKVEKYLSDKWGINITLGGLQSSPSWVSAKVNNGVKLDGTAQYIWTAPIYYLNVPPPVTIAAWFKTASTANSGIIRKDTLTGTRYLYGLNINNTPGCGAGAAGKVSAEYVNANGVFCALSNSALNDNSFHHAAMMINGTTLTLYIDGVAQSQTATITGTIGTPTGEMDIGADPPCCTSLGRSSFLNGTVDEVGIWNRALSAAEISGLAATQTQGQISCELGIKNNATPLKITSSSPLSPFTWNHVVCTYDGNPTSSNYGKAVLYVNNKNEASSNAATAGPLNVPNNASVVIGKNVTNNQTLVGKLDDIRVYSYALSASEVSDLYNTPPSPGVLILTNPWKIFGLDGVFDIVNI